MARRASAKAAWVVGGAAVVGAGYLVKRLPDVVRVVRATHTLVNIDVSSVLQPKDS